MWLFLPFCLSSFFLKKKLIFNGSLLIIIEDTSHSLKILESFTVNVTDGCGCYFLNLAVWRSVWGSVMMEKKRCVSVCVFKREREREREGERKRERYGGMDRVRMRPLAVMCPHSSDTTMWHSSVGLLHVLREREGDGRRERGPPTMPIEYCEAAAGGTCSDLKAIYSGQDRAPLTTLLLLYAWKWMDGQCLSL